MKLNAKRCLTVSPSQQRANVHAPLTVPPAPSEPSNVLAIAVGLISVLLIGSCGFVHIQYRRRLLNGRITATDIIGRRHADDISQNHFRKISLAIVAEQRSSSVCDEGEGAEVGGSAGRGARQQQLQSAFR